MDLYGYCGKITDMGQGWRTDRRLPLVAVTAVGGLLAALTLAAWSPDVAAASTVVSLATAAQIELSSGILQVAHAGDAVPHGARLRTAVDGQATLVTLGRTTYVGAASVLKVIDGARQELSDGTAMVDTRQAPGLALRTDAAGVTITKGSVVRIERGAMLRVADFAGSSSIVPTGRRASTTIAALWQVQIALGALPGPVTALALTGDRWERALMSDLISEDADLTSLAAGLDGPGSAGAAVVAALPASLRFSEPLTPGAPRSEQTLAYAMAVAARSGSLADRFARVRTLRTGGGSWAVVARLVDAPVVAIEGVLEGLLDPTSAAGIVLASHPDGGALLDFAVLVGGSSTAGQAAGGRQFGAEPPEGGGGSAPTASPLPGNPPLPIPVPVPVPTSIPSTPVQQVVDTVVALLPTPTPSASTPAAAPTAPSVPKVPAVPTAPAVPIAVPSVPAVSPPTVLVLPVRNVPAVPIAPTGPIPVAPVRAIIGKADGLSLG